MSSLRAGGMLTLRTPAPRAVLSPAWGGEESPALRSKPPPDRGFLRCLTTAWSQIISFHVLSGARSGLCESGFPEPGLARDSLPCRASACLTPCPAAHPFPPGCSPPGGPAVCHSQGPTVGTAQVSGPALPQDTPQGLHSSSKLAKHESWSSSSQV